MMIVVLYVVLNDYGGIEIVCDSLKKIIVDIFCIVIY